MRAPKRKRSLVRRVVAPPPDIDLPAVAKRVVFVGSPEHKDTPSFAGQPTPRSDASLCDASLKDSQKELTTALREAIRNGQVGECFEGGFPRYVWCRIEPPSAKPVWPIRGVANTRATH